MALSILVSQSAGIIGSIFTLKAIPDWYQGLKKPAFAPPGKVIGAVWIVLYTLMGIASYLVWRKGLARPDVKGALAAFAAQLSVNAFWSIAFFGLRSTLAGLVTIGILWLLVLKTMLRFFRISWPAGLLLVPYILWISFAAYLNHSIWRLNR